MEDILAVVYDIPVPKEPPPVRAAYQLIVPADAVAPRETVPASHLDAGVFPVIVGVVLTVATTDVLGLEVHPLFMADT